MKKTIAAAVTAAALSLALAPAAHAEYVESCPSGRTAVATVDTSCVFADSVRAAYYSQPGSTVVAQSPKTGLFYTMQCGGHWNVVFADGYGGEAKRCFGVNSFGAVLVVYID